MTAINHIVGGSAFTAFFCSLHDINIFQKPEYIAYTVFFSLLPDIDHTRSTIGKVFFPIAKIIDKKYGHRTITHSLLAYILLCAFFFLLEFFFPKLQNITTIFAYSYISHLFFDSMTKQAIPLFYPFLKNPTCLPANPDLRFDSGNIKIEGIFLAAFCLILGFCQPLYANGFWTTYNRTFATLKHLHREFKKNENFITCEYTFSRLGKNYAGVGFVAASEENMAQIFDTLKGFTEINEDCKNIKVLPNKTNIQYKTQELFFTYITPDSLHRLINSKAILKLHCVSNSPISYIKDKKLQTSESCDLDYTFNPTLKFLQDSIKVFEIEDNIELHKEDLSFTQKQRSKISELIKKTDDSITFLKEIYQTKSYTEQHQILDKLEILKNHLHNLQIESNRYVESGKSKTQIKNLETKIVREKNVKVSGYIAFLVLK